MRLLLRQWLPLLAAVVFIALFARLGFWQAERAVEKEQIEAGFAALEHASPLPLDQFSRQADFQPVVLAGQFIVGQTLLLDNQIRDGQPGVHVFTPFESAGGGAVILVNRGWQAMPDRQTLPSVEPPTGRLTLTGRLNRPPGAGLRLAEQSLTTAPAQLVTRIDLAEIEPWLGQPVAQQVLLATGPVAFTTDWQPSFMPASRHRGYSFQWFALAATVLIVTLVLQWRGRATRRPGNSQR